MSESKTKVNLDAGLYVNLFEVEFEDRDVDLMSADRSEFASLRALREELDRLKYSAGVYAVSDAVYGYGSDKDKLVQFGFARKSVRLREIPQLTSRLILEGFAENLHSAGYTCHWSFGRVFAYQFLTPLLITQSGVKLIRGVELHSLYLIDPSTERLIFAMIVDGVFTYQHQSGKRLNSHEVVIEFGNETLKQLRIKQGDLAPFGGINLEVSRQRLLEFILPFVRARSQFILLDSIQARLIEQPIRVVLSD